MQNVKNVDGSSAMRNLVDFSDIKKPKEIIDMSHREYTEKLQKLTPARQKLQERSNPIPIT